MYKFEKELLKLGYKNIAGIDEVGRGCIAGPLVCAIVILPINYSNDKIKDSKQLTPIKRKKLSEIIKQDALAYHIEIIEPKIVDKLNPKQASRYAMSECVKKISLKPDYLLIDFEHIDCEIKQKSIIKGDQQSISIAAASIIAKVYRDEIMEKLALKYPQYDFQNNKGYLTKKHTQAIIDYGPIHNIHRYTYRPIRK